MTMERRMYNPPYESDVYDHDKRGVDDEASEERVNTLWTHSKAELVLALDSIYQYNKTLSSLNEYIEEILIDRVVTAETKQYWRGLSTAYKTVVIDLTRRFKNLGL